MPHPPHTDPQKGPPTLVSCCYVESLGIAISPTWLMLPSIPGQDPSPHLRCGTERRLTESSIVGEPPSISTYVIAWISIQSFTVSRG